MTMSLSSLAAIGVITARVISGSQRFYRRLLTEQVLPAHALQRLQGGRATAHARFAMSTTVFCRHFYSGIAFKLLDLDDPAAFAELPISEKSHERENFDALHSSKAAPSNSKVSITGRSLASCFVSYATSKRRSEPSAGDYFPGGASIRRYADWFPPGSRWQGGADALDFMVAVTPFSSQRLPDGDFTNTKAPL